MNDFDGLLSSDFGLKLQGKSAPMSASKSKSRSSSSSLNFDLGSGTSNFDPDAVLGSRGAQKKPPGREEFGDLFGGPPKSKENSFDFDSMFAQGSKASSSVPIYDKPVYDDDIFEGLPGVKSFGSSLSGKKYGDEFESGPNSVSSPPSRKAGGSSAFDDLLGGFGKAESQSKNRSSTKEEDKSVPDFDDLIPGFGGSSLPGERSTRKSTWSSEPVSTTRKNSEDPFAGLGSVPLRAAPSSADPSDPLQEFSNLGRSGSRKADGPSVSSGMVYDDLDPFEGLAKSVPSSSSETNGHWKDKSPLRTDRGSRESPTYNSEEHVDKTSPTAGGRSHKPISTDNIDVESHKTFFDMPSASNSFTERTEPVGTAHYENIYSSEANVPGDVCEEKAVCSDDVWLTVSEIPLFTQPTTAPPPARPPPPRPTHASKVGKSSFGSKQAKKSEFYASSTFEIPKSSPETGSNTINEFEDYPAVGRNARYNSDAQVNGVSSEEMGFNSDAAASAAAMKEAMDRAEAKFRHAKGVREREGSRAARTKESVQLEKDDNWLDAEERALREKQEQFQREREDEEKERRRIEKEREREEKEREQRRLDRERDRAKEERERARQAVERATREARERAAAEARTKAERAVVDKVNAEARGRAERTAVMRAQAEARERAAADAKERAERAAEARDREARMREKESAEAREKEAREKTFEARRRVERAAVERAAAEARERAAAEARERAAAAAKANQRKNDNDLESFFSMGRASSAPRPRANSAEASFDAQFPNKKGPEVARTSDTTASNIRKASSSTNIVDDLSSIFGGGPTSGEFQDVEGETEERRRARLERHQRTQERAAKALAEKNQRDLDAQRDQAERHRFSESLDAEIKRWAAGKEGNLRALLSTLQYVLWPECGWQPVSLTDLITAAAVKKVYRKATLCIHPDKVQQKGANLQQKYIAEKVFDLLKEAWNKLNSEELF